LKSIQSLPALFAGLTMLVAPALSSAGVFVSITVAPPALPVYVQPPCPVDGYLWTPGYWAYGDPGYNWVPGVWVATPRVGLLWTPAWWGFEGGFYGFHASRVFRGRLAGRALRL
jgi:WXXGXW repeat (2 copies)